MPLRPILRLLLTGLLAGMVLLTLKNDGRPGARVTLAMHRGEDILPKTLLSVLEQAEMSREEFLEFL